MMRFLIVTAFFALTFGALSMQQANSMNGVDVVGDPCSPVGRTIMSTDKKDILACVCSTTAGCTGTADLKWKSQSVSTLTVGSYTCPSGYVLTGIVNNVAQCSQVPALNYTCPAGQAITGFNNGTPVCSAWSW